MNGEKPHKITGYGQAEVANGEVVSFHRRSELPGVEVRSLKNSARAFRYYGTDFEFFAPSTWRGQLWHRRQQTMIEPGTLLCAHPGEVFLVSRVITPGAGNFLSIDAQVFQEHLTDPDSASKRQLRAFTRMSKSLTERLREVIRVVRPGPSALEIQSALVEFVGVMILELLEESSGAEASIESGLRVAQRVRECLHYDSSATVDLSSLAKQAGVSRYQALRQFKRRYGLPPHTYQLHVRLALAQRALREGQPPVQVAAQYGFVDQSHFTRHFKRLLGVTPAHYARGGTRSRTLKAQIFLEPFPGSATSSRRSTRITDYGSLA